MFQNRCARPAGVCSLNRLRELHMVTNEHDVLRAHAPRDNISQANLPRLVDKEIVQCLIEFGTSKKPSRPGDQTVCGTDGYTVRSRIVDEAAAA